MLIIICRTTPFPVPAVRPHEAKASPFPHPPQPAPSSIPPLIPSTPPAAAGPDVKLNLSCKSPLNQTSTRLVLYDASCFESQSVVKSLVGCTCTHVNTCSCPSLQTLLIHWGSKPQTPPKWFLETKASFRNSFSTHSLRGHVAVVDPNQGVLYLPLNAFSHFPEAGIKTPHETLKQVNFDTTVTFLSTLINHSDSRITTLVLEPCLTHISSLSFRECVALVHSARKSIQKPVRFEVRMSLPSPKVLSYCRMHSDAPRVCFSCFAQTLDPSVTECTACSPTPSLQSYAAAASIKSNLSDQGSREPKPSSSVESQMLCFTDNFSSVFNKLHDHARKISTLETQISSEQWATHTAKNCSSNKSVEKVRKAIAAVELEVHTLVPRLSQLESSVFQIKNQLNSLTQTLKSLTPPSLSTPSVSSAPRETVETETEAEVHNVQ